MPLYTHLEWCYKISQHYRVSNYIWEVSAPWFTLYNGQQSVRNLLKSSFGPITVQEAKSAVLRVTVSGTHCHLFVIVTDNKKAQAKHHAPQLLSGLQLGVPGNRLFWIPTYHCPLNWTHLLMSVTSIGLKHNSQDIQHDDKTLRATDSSIALASW